MVRRVCHKHYLQYSHNIDTPCVSKKLVSKIEVVKTWGSALGIPQINLIYNLDIHLPGLQGFGGTVII